MIGRRDVILSSCHAKRVILSSSAVKPMATTMYTTGSAAMVWLKLAAGTLTNAGAMPIASHASAKPDSDALQAHETDDDA